MNGLLHNMSCPPRSKVDFEQTQLEKYIAFNPKDLAGLLGNENMTADELKTAVENYVKNHPDIERIIEKPTGYMIGEVGVMNNENKITSKSKTVFDYEVCKNLELMIVVLCSTVGDLYIPDRQMSFENTKFDKILLFPKNEVES